MNVQDDHDVHAGEAQHFVGPVEASDSASDNDISLAHIFVGTVVEGSVDKDGFDVVHERDEDIHAVKGPSACGIGGYEHELGYVETSDVRHGFCIIAIGNDCDISPLAFSVVNTAPAGE